MYTKNFPALLISALLLFFAVVFSQSSANLFKREALKYMNSGRYGEAINVLNELIVENPQSAEGFNLRGICYEKRAQFKEATLDLRQAVELAPDNQQFKQNLSRVKEKLRKVLQEKILGYQRELAINPNAVKYYFILGEYYEILGQWKEAEIWYDRYFQIADASSEEISYYTEILARKNQLAKAITILEAYLDSHPNDYKLLSRYGYYLLWSGRFNEAYAAFERALEIEPDYKEAYEGLVQADAEQYFPADRKGDSLMFQESPHQKIKSLYEYLEIDPYDRNQRYLLARELIKAKRLQEAFDQLEILLEDLPDSEKNFSDKTGLWALSDSVYQVLLYNYSKKLDRDPTDRNTVLLLANLYQIRGDVDQLLKLLWNYLTHIPNGADSEIRFKYAQYASWQGKFRIALNNLEILLSEQPENLDYQLLKGQILVWTVQELDQARIYLENVYNHQPLNISAILALASLNAFQNNFIQSQEYLKLAKEIDPENKDIEAVERVYEDALKAYAEKQTYSLLERGRQLVEEGNCQAALEKYEQYLARVEEPPKAVLLEYADVNTCTKDLIKAIEIYDAILEEGEDFDVALRRARVYLWNENAELALSELNRLTSQKPNHFESRLYTGDVYFSMSEYSRAKEIYETLLSDSSNPAQAKTVRTRMDYLPKTGLSGITANFPSQLAVVPLFYQYSDNEDFRMNHLGGNLEIGMTHFLTVGASLININLESSQSTRFMRSIKGRLYLRPFKNISLSAGFGTLNSSGMSGRNISDVNMQYKISETFTTTVNYENTDATLLLYSPYLIDLEESAQHFRIRGNYQHRTTFRLSGDFSHLTISDGNSGNQFRIRLGKKLYDEAYFGYESEYLDYKFLSPSLPSDTLGIKRLYYSPQNLDSHSLWFDWNLENNKKLTFDLQGKLGYIPSFNALLREIQGVIEYRPLNNLNIGLNMALGSSTRFESSYSYFTTTLSAYWRL